MFIIPVFLLFLLACTYAAYRMAFYSPRKREEDVFALPKGEQYQQGSQRMLTLIRDMNAIPFERVEIRARDGSRLVGRYYHVADGAPLQIQFHGYRGNGVRDFCGGNRIAREHGQNALVIVERAHGESDGTTICFGVRERYDCLDWIEYANRRFGPDTHIYLSGVSMGAATVLMASGLDLPANVRGIIADCPFSSPKAIILKVARDMGLPPFIAWPLIYAGARLFGGFDPSGCSAADAVRRARVPILIIHGEDDRFVPCDMSREIHAANPEMITLETFPGAGHGLSYIVDTPRYEKASLDFIDRCENNR